MDCPAYKNLIDRQPDLRADEAADLAHHVASCAECRGYKTAADKTQHLLRAFRKQLASVEPVDLALESLSARLAASRRQLLWSCVLVAVCVVAPFAMFLRDGAMWSDVSWLVFACAIGAFIVTWQIPREQAAIKSLTRRDGDFFATWRSDLERRVRMTTGGAVLVAIWSAGMLLFAALKPFEPVETSVVLGAAFLLAFGALNTFFVELRDLKSELALVDEASRG